MSVWKTLPLKSNLPSTMRFPCNREVPYTSIPSATLKCFPIPTPPDTTNAPESVVVEFVVFIIVVIPATFKIPETVVSVKLEVPDTNSCPVTVSFNTFNPAVIVVLKEYLTQPH